MTAFAQGDTVEWNWGHGSAAGKIKKVYTSKITRTIKGTEVTRDASEGEPAYYIEQDDGSKVLKSHTEVKAK